MSAVRAAVAASFVSVATSGTWSISCSEPCPQRVAGARPPSTSIGEWLACAEAIALIAFVTPGPAVTAAAPGAARDLRPALGRERRGLLVAHVDDLDPLGPAAVVDREQMAAGEREELRDPVRLQAPGDEMPADDPDLARRFRRHRAADPISEQPRSHERASAAPSISSDSGPRRGRFVQPVLAAEQQPPDAQRRQARRARGQQPASELLDRAVAALRRRPPRASRAGRSRRRPRPRRGSRDRRCQSRRRTPAATPRARTPRRSRARPPAMPRASPRARAAGARRATSAAGRAAARALAAAARRVLPELGAVQHAGERRLPFQTREQALRALGREIRVRRGQVEEQRRRGQAAARERRPAVAAPRDARPAKSRFPYDHNAASAAKPAATFAQVSHLKGPCNRPPSSGASKRHYGACSAPAAARPLEPGP